MIELLRMHPTGKNPKDATPVFVVTRNGSDYIDEGLKYIKDTLKELFQEENDLIIYTGSGLNVLKILKAQFEKHLDAYCVLSYNEGVMFFPRKCNKQIIENLTTVHEENPKENAWNVLMQMIERKPY